MTLKRAFIRLNPVVNRRSVSSKPSIHTMSSTPDGLTSSWDPYENPHTQSILDDAKQEADRKKANFDPNLSASSSSTSTDVSFKYPSPQRIGTRYAPYYAMDGNTSGPVNEESTESGSQSDFEHPEDSPEDYEAFAQERRNTDAPLSQQPSLGIEDGREEDGCGPEVTMSIPQQNRASDELHFETPESDSDSEDDLMRDTDEVFPETVEGQRRRALRLESSIQLQRQRLRRVSAKKRDMKTKIKRLKREKLAAERSIALMNLGGLSGGRVEGEAGSHESVEEPETGGEDSRHVSGEPVATQPSKGTPYNRSRKDTDWRRFAIENSIRMARLEAKRRSYWTLAKGGYKG